MLWFSVAEMFLLFSLFLLADCTGLIDALISDPFYRRYVFPASIVFGIGFATVERIVDSIREKRQIQKKEEEKEETHEQ